ncbi:unnamed protein product [Rotaria sordida]|uniref:ABC transmembrane type-1 domain-containing protein n=1 Tax=Rotaria sordida TaxID=392033 RepID=A0A815A3D2_9BILA|nr:unnamed protein product [Rotaria sordida]
MAECQRHSNLHLEYSQIRQEIDWFGYRNAGELSSHLVKNHENIREGFGFCLTDFIIRLSRIIASLIFSFYVGWKLTLIFLSISPLIVLSFNHLIEVIIKYTILELLAYNTANYIAQDVLVAIRTVIAFGEQDKETEQYRKNLSVGKRVSIQKGFILEITRAIVNIVLYSAILQSFAEASDGYVFDINKREKKINIFRNDGEISSNFIGDTEFKNVYFTYPSRKELSILNGLSVEISSGKAVALCGPSGYGKSITIQLIQSYLAIEKVKCRQ